MSADVDWRSACAILIDNLRLAAIEVVDHPEDGLLIAGNDAGGEHHRIALLDLGVLVIIDRSTRER